MAGWDWASPSSDGHPVAASLNKVPEMPSGAVHVIQRHLDAVRGGDPYSMAADYAPDAVLERAGTRWIGREQVASYFLTVPARLAGGRVQFTGFDPVALTVRWQIVGGPGDGTSGTDTYEVRDGQITRQTVQLSGGADF